MTVYPRWFGQNPMVDSRLRADSLRQLSSNWHTAKDLWNDAATQDFEKEFIAEFETTTAVSMDRLQDLIDTITQAERRTP